MNPAITLATASRVLSQLRHDHRTLAMLIVVPCVLLALLAWVFAGTTTFDAVGAPLLGIFPFVIMFLVTSVATLRERTSGTLERLLTLPIGKLDLLMGYALAFGLVAVVQAGAATALAVTLLGLDVAGPVWLLLVVAVLDALLGMALGLLVSAFAATEFQAVQSCRRSSCRSSCSAACSCPATGWPAFYEPSPTCSRCPTPSTRWVTSPCRKASTPLRGATCPSSGSRSCSPSGSVRQPFAAVRPDPTPSHPPPVIMQSWLYDHNCMITGGWWGAGRQW